MMRIACWLLPLLLCPGSAAFAEVPGATKRAAAPVRSHAGTTLIFSGTCDASGAVELSGGRFALADDEDTTR
jgi:hypothetical protein